MHRAAKRYRDGIQRWCASHLQQSGDDGDVDGLYGARQMQGRHDSVSVALHDVAAAGRHCHRVGADATVRQQRHDGAVAQVHDHVQDRAAAVVNSVHVTAVVDERGCHGRRSVLRPAVQCLDQCGGVAVVGGLHTAAVGH